MVTVCELSGALIPGDVNNDGKIDLLDISSFIDAIAIGVFDPAADINVDGTDELLDIEEFIELLQNSLDLGSKLFGDRVSNR